MKVLNKNTEFNIENLTASEDVKKAFDRIMN
jgi:hypothetical protein